MSSRQENLLIARLAIRSGYGTSIDLEDYDAPVPRWYADGIRDGDHVNRPEAVFPCFRFMSELTSMSILLGQACEYCVLKYR